MVDTIKAFRLVLENVERGQKIIYYTGDLMYDRTYNTKLTKTNRRDLNSLAAAIYDAYEVGRVFLTQKRMAPHVWEYQATLRR